MAITTKQQRQQLGRHLPDPRADLTPGSDVEQTHGSGPEPQPLHTTTSCMPVGRELVANRSNNNKSKKAPRNE